MGKTCVWSTQTCSSPRHYPAQTGHLPGGSDVTAHSGLTGARLCMLGPQSGSGLCGGGCVWGAGRVNGIDYQLVPFLVSGILGVSEGTHEGSQVDTTSFHGLAGNSVLAVDGFQEKGLPESRGVTCQLS